MDNINIEDIIDIDLYEVLNIEKNTNDKDIKKQYKKLILKFHPDKNSNTDNNEIYELITLAYNILINKELKVLYDELRLTKSEWDFTRLKKESLKTTPNYEKKNFNDLNNTYNIKHGYDTNEKILDINDFNKKLYNLIEERKKEIKNYKKLNDKEFKEKFNNIKRNENKLNNELMPYNLELILLNGINQISKLYDTGESEIDKRFLINSLAKYNENKLSYEEQMKKYNNNN
jgi:curved DNA-binding protein CbpA